MSSTGRKRTKRSLLSLITKIINELRSQRSGNKEILKMSFELRTETGTKTELSKRFEIEKLVVKIYIEN